MTVVGNSFDVACNGVLLRGKERRENFALGASDEEIGKGKISGGRVEGNGRGRNEKQGIRKAKEEYRRMTEHRGQRERRASPLRGPSAQLFAFL